MNDKAFESIKLSCVLRKFKNFLPVLIETTVVPQCLK
jgi:hypothetical protein